jgi:hypothetical protein
MLATTDLVKIMAVNANAVPLVASVGNVLKQVLKGSSITVEGEISADKLRKPRQGSQPLKRAFPKFTFNIF